MPDISTLEDSLDKWIWNHVSLVSGDVSQQDIHMYTSLWLEYPIL